MELRERFLSLPARGRRVVHEQLIEGALAAWNAYAGAHGEIRYQEAVCGTEQVLDARLPEDALASVRSGDGIDAVAQRYGEPLAALQDGDLSLPEPVEFAYYAVYNFFRKYAQQEDVDDWMIVNQAGSSEGDERKWGGMLTKAIEKARQQAPA